jgi:hypothetical protein
MTSVEWNRQYMCNPRSDEDGVFKQEHIENALQRGNGHPGLNSPRMTNGHLIARGISGNVPSRYRIYVGVDLGIRVKDSADPTVIFVVAEHNDGIRSLEVLNIESGKWHGDEIIRRIVSAGERFQATAILVEDNAAQKFLVDSAKHRTKIPIRGFTTGRNKINPEYGIEAIAGEMEKGRWIIPNEDGKVDRETAGWIREMLDYDPKSHTGDALMASWLAREAARQGARAVQTFTLDTLRR